MENDGPPSLERVQRWKLAKANWDQFQDLCSTRLQQSAIADADDPINVNVIIPFVYVRCQNTYVWTENIMDGPTIF